jgi:hypothetical protein
MSYNLNPFNYGWAATAMELQKQDTSLLTEVVCDDDSDSGRRICFKEVLCYQDRMLMPVSRSKEQRQRLVY